MLSKKFSSATFLTILAVCNALPGFAQELNPHWNTGRGPDIQAPFLMADYSSNTPNERKVTEDTSGFLQWTDNGAGLSYSLGYGASPLGLSRGGTGGATQQAAINSLLGYSGLASQDIIYYDGSNWSIKHKGSNGQVLGIDGSGLLNYISPAGSGTVTSVGLTVPSWLTVGGSPVTGAGTLAIVNGTGLTANRIVGTDGSGNLDLMAMTANQVPSLNASKITSGNLTKAVSATEGVYNDQNNTYAGAYTQDFSDASQNVKLPLRAVATSNGSVSVDSSDLAFYAGGAAHKAAKQATTISAGTGLTGGGDLSANRTISLSTPVAETNGGTGQTTWTTGQIPYASASNTLSKLSIGSTGQVLGVSGGLPAWITPGGGFGGNGSDGAITISGATGYTAPIQKNATTFTVNSSQTLTLTGSPTIINCTSTFTVNGTVTVADGSGYAGGQCWPKGGYYGEHARDGYGPGGGFGGGGYYSLAETGGGGGGFGADGGNPSYTTTAFPGGGKAYPTNLIGGSGGGGAPYITLGSGAAGAGGGSVIVCAVGAISVPSGGTINAKGTAAVSPTSGSGPGGGSGGMVFLASQDSVSHASGSTINVSGGAGAALAGAGQGHGGGGAGGRLYRWAPSITATGTFTATGGAAGGTGATAGGTGTATSITGTPSLPLLTWTFEEGGMSEIERIRQERIVTAELNGERINPVDVEIDGRCVITRAAKGDLRRFALFTTPAPFGQELPSVTVGDIEKPEGIRNAV